MLAASPERVRTSANVNSGEPQPRFLSTFNNQLTESSPYTLLICFRMMIFTSFPMLKKYMAQIASKGGMAG